MDIIWILFLFQNITAENLYVMYIVLSTFQI